MDYNGYNSADLHSFFHADKVALRYDCIFGMYTYAKAYFLSEVYIQHRGVRDLLLKHHTLESYSEDINAVCSGQAFLPPQQ